MANSSAVHAMILALPETAGSALYGMVDVLAATGTIWRELVGEEPGLPLIRLRIVSPEERPFRCGNGIPVSPDVTIAQARAPDVVIVPELWLAPTDDIRDRHSGVKQWLRHCYEAAARSTRLAPARCCSQPPGCSMAARRPLTGATRTCCGGTF